MSRRGCSLYRVDDLGNVKKGGVSVYYKETLAVHFLQTKSDQCIVNEIAFKNKKKGHVISLYIPPSQTPDQFDTFLQSFEELLRDIFKLKSSFVLITGDFNCKSSLCSTCHHQTFFAKLNMKVKYPPPYESIFLDYSRAGKASINQEVNAIDWEELFAKKTVKSQVSEFNDLLLNIYSNYMPNNTALCDDKDSSWMNN